MFLFSLKISNIEINDMQTKSFIVMKMKGLTLEMGFIFIKVIFFWRWAISSSCSYIGFLLRSGKRCPCWSWRWASSSYTWSCWRLMISSSCSFWDCSLRSGRSSPWRSERVFRSMDMADEGNGFQVDEWMLSRPVVIWGKEGCGTGGKCPGALVEILNFEWLILSHKVVTIVSLDCSPKTWQRFL